MLAAIAPTLSAAEVDDPALALAVLGPGQGAQIFLTPAIPATCALPARSA